MKTNFLLLISFILLAGCQKYLDQKPDRSQTIPSTIEDAQALLDRNAVLNVSHPAASEGSADDYFLLDADFTSLTTDGLKNNYTWGEELYYSVFPNDWSNVYAGIYITQLALQTLEKVDRTSSNAAEYDNAKGQALFHRARLYHTAALLWAKAYDPSYAATAPGIPLRMTTDFNEVSVRSTLSETYDQIEKDLLTAIASLDITPVHVMRPSKPAAYAQLARVYLSMGRYDKAGLYADSTLQLKNELVDYNTISAAPAFPFSPFNKEVLFVSNLPVNALLNTARAFIDSNLYASYNTNDLRRTLFFKDNGAKKIAFRGSYNGNSSLMVGVCIDEVLLIRAECYARTGSITAAMNDLNTLLIKRFKSGTFSQLKVSTQQQALSLVLTERRKELVMRDIRWMDLKRLNREPDFAAVIKRKLNAQLIELPAGSPRYALPIPAVIIDQTGMPQNER